MTLLLKNARLIDPVAGSEQPGDILIVDGKIKKISMNIQTKEKVREIDLSGKVITTGFIDMHVHLRDPGYEEKETIATGTEAAATGGFTTVVAMPNTKPALDNETVIEYLNRKVESEGCIEVLPCASLTKERNGSELAEYGILKKAGACALSDDGDPVNNSEVLRRAMEYSLSFDLPILSHCEDKMLSDGGLVHEGYYSTILGLKGIPAIAEDIVVARDITLAEYTGARLHICHVSTAGAVELIRAAKKKGLKVTGEVAPHHFSLTDAATVGYNTSTKVNPPLRTTDDIVAIIEGLVDGTLDVIASDHAPHTGEDKDVEYEQAAFGISGVETSVAIALDHLYHRKKLTLIELIKKYTISPATVLGIEYAGLVEGRDANLTVLDLELLKKVDIKKFKSKGKNNPFDGMELKGWPVMTIYKGKIVAENL